MRVRVKICGIRAESDLHAALDAGADAVGFNFWSGSTRYVSPEAAAALVRELPDSVMPIGVFVGATPDEVERAVEASGVRAAQLHGDEDLTRYVGLPVDLIQVVRVRGRESLPRGPANERVRLVLLDSFVEGFGGRGVSFDWSLVAEAAAKLARPILLAGGLTPANVADAVRLARPWGVDVASGVESAPGVKDPGKVRAFVEAARAAAREVGEP